MEPYQPADPLFQAYGRDYNPSFTELLNMNVSNSSVDTATSRLSEGKAAMPQSSNTTNISAQHHPPGNSRVNSSSSATQAATRSEHFLQEFGNDIVDFAIGEYSCHIIEQKAQKRLKVGIIQCSILGSVLI